MRSHLLLTAVLLAGCVSGEFDSTTQASETANALSENRLSYNRLSYNRLSYNRLSYNRLSYNRLSYNSLDNDIQDTADGLEILRYVARCALDEGTSLVVDLADGKTIEFPGMLGLAPKWEERELEVSEQRRVSGCLIAHVNAFGVAVPISVRYVYWLPSTKEELERFSRYEGSFFGNLFDPDGALYSCHADDVPDLSDPARLDTTYGDRLLRRCTDGECGPITSLGPCSEMCGWPLTEGYTICKVPDSDLEGYYMDMVNVYLLDADDPEAAWPTLIEPLFGRQKSTRTRKK